MANLADPNLLANLATELDRVAKVCRLPHGWIAKPSFRLTPQGASLLVVWQSAPAAADLQQSRAAKKKTRSKASRKRSAARAAAHKAWKTPGMVSRPGANPSARVFTPMTPAQPPPNSVGTVGPPATESERVGRVDGPNAQSVIPNQNSQIITTMLSPPPPPPLRPVWGGIGVGGSSSELKRGREEELRFDRIASAGRALFDRWECGDQIGLSTAGEVVDRLAGQRGLAQGLVEGWIQQRAGEQGCTG